MDLAGSERSTLAAKDDGDNKLRQTEGSAINKSLLTLGNVIRGLGDGRVRILPLSCPQQSLQPALDSALLVMLLHSCVCMTFCSQRSQCLASLMFTGTCVCISSANVASLCKQHL